MGEIFSIFLLIFRTRVFRDILSERNRASHWSKRTQVLSNDLVPCCVSLLGGLRLFLLMSFLLEIQDGWKTEAFRSVEFLPPPPNRNPLKVESGVAQTVRTDDGICVSLFLPCALPSCFCFFYSFCYFSSYMFSCLVI